MDIQLWGLTLSRLLCVFLFYFFFSVRFILFHLRMCMYVKHNLMHFNSSRCAVSLLWLLKYNFDI